MSIRWLQTNVAVRCSKLLRTVLSNTFSLRVDHHFLQNVDERRADERIAPDPDHSRLTQVVARRLVDGFVRQRA